MANAEAKAPSASTSSALSDLSSPDTPPDAAPKPLSISKQVKAKPRPSKVSTTGTGTPKAKSKAEGTPKVKAEGKAKAKGTPKTGEEGGDKSGKVGKKRKSEVGEEGGGKKVKVDGEKGIYCHQCRQKCEAAHVVRCTRLRPGPGGQAKACNLAWCDRDLVRKYELDPESIRSGGQVGKAGEGEHDTSKEYVFDCPCCRDECLSSQCRRVRGDAAEKTAKAPTAADLFDDELSELSDDEGDEANGTAKPKANGTSTPKSKSKATTASAKKSTAKGSASKSQTKVKASGSKASPSKTKTPSKVTPKSKAATPKSKAAGTPKVKSASKAGTGKATPSKNVASAKKASAKKDTKDGKPKKAGKGKEAEEVVKPKRVISEEAKARMRERREQAKLLKLRPVVHPPAFEKVDTKLTREEAENRIYLREYVYRFRTVLGLPDRFLGPLDDFDRPLTEASVRLLGGALVEIIRDDLEEDESMQDLVDTLQQNREELRYYADLARFANIYNNLATHLNLTLPTAPVARDDTSAIRALLDLGDNEATPAWALESSAPARRTGASRIPQPTEVVRMLIALMEYTISCRRIRFELDSAWGEWEVRKANTSAVSAMNKEWEREKKGIMTKRIKCKSADEMKKNAEELREAEKEHKLRGKLLSYNLQATMASKSFRFEPLGVDLDGRTYFWLTQRPISDDMRPPIGWASGLLIWGQGVPPIPTDTTAATDGSDPKPASANGVAADSNGLPYTVERWTHFGRSSAVQQLIEWWGSRILDEQNKLHVANKAKAKAAGSKTPTKGTKTPTKASASASKANGVNGVSKSAGKKTPMVVIPSAKKGGKSSGTGTPTIDSFFAPMNGSASKSKPESKAADAVVTNPMEATPSSKVVNGTPQVNGHATVSTSAVPTPSRAQRMDVDGDDGEKDDDSDLSSVPDPDEAHDEAKQAELERDLERQRLEDERLAKEEAERRDVERREHLATLVNPEGWEEYRQTQPTSDNVARVAMLMVTLAHVRDWMELLEWKGMGEVV